MVSSLWVGGSTYRSEVLLPEMDCVTRNVIEVAEASADMPMLALTHGQPATPTTMGKELGNFAYVKMIIFHFISRCQDNASVDTSLCVYVCVRVLFGFAVSDLR